MQILRLEKRYIEKENMPDVDCIKNEMLLTANELKIPENVRRNLGIVFFTNYDSFVQKANFLYDENLSYVKKKILFKKTSNNYITMELAKKLELTGPVFTLFKNSIDKYKGIILTIKLVDFYKKNFLLVLLEEKQMIIEYVYIVVLL